MNSASFQNMNMAAPRPQAAQQPGGMQRNGPASTDIRPHIIRILQSKPPPKGGWQEMVQIQTRVGVVHQMVTQLLIVKPQMEMLHAINAAAAFEMDNLENSPDKTTYDAALRQKLTEFHRTRQQQASAQQQQFQNPQIAQMGPTQQQSMAQRMGQSQGFGMQQPPQPGQPLGNSMQQQQMLHQQQMIRMGSGPDGQQPIQNGQPMQGMPRPMPQNRGQPQFTQQETQQILIFAQQIERNMAPQERETLQRQMANLPPHQLQSMQAQGINPFQAFFRSQATKRFLDEKERRQRANQGFGPPGVAAENSQARPASQVSMRTQGHQVPASGPQPPYTSFAVGNMEQFIGQQQDALRHQEAGQMVVPMSNPQGAPPQVRGTLNAQGQSQFNPNRPMQPQNAQSQPFWNNQPTQQQNLQQPSQMQKQPPTPNFPGMTKQTPQLQGQLGGLSNNRGQRTTQQNHNMPTLNQPLENQAQTQNDPPQRQAHPTPRTNPRNAPNGSQTAPTITQPNAGPSRSQAAQAPQGQWAKVPPHIRQQLMNMPEGQRKLWMLQMQQKQQQQRMKAAADAKASANSDLSFQSAQQGVPAGTQVNSSKASTAALNASQTPINPVTPVNMQQSQGGRQQVPSNSARPQQSKMVPIRLNENQVRQMDSLNFPQSIINRTSDLGNLPDNVRTWRQLKEYVQRYEPNLPPGSQMKVAGLQSIHFQLNQQALQKRPPVNNHQQPQGTMGAAPVGQMMPPLQHAQSLQGLPAPAPGAFRFPPVPEPTAQEMQAARATIKLHMQPTITDDQLRLRIMQKRQKDMENHMQRSNSQQAQLASPQQNHVPAAANNSGQLQQPPRGQPHPPQLGLLHTQAQQQARQTGQPPKPSPGAWAGVQPEVPKPNQKGLKRNNNDDVIEVPDPKLAQHQGRPPNSKVGQTPAMGNGIITAEQYASLPDEQKMQYQFQRRMQAAQRAKIIQANSQSIQGQMAASSVNQSSSSGPSMHTRLGLLMNEVSQTTPRRLEVPMSPSTRNKMIERLKTRTRGLVEKMEQMLPAYLGLSNDENQAKELLRIRFLLLQQVRDQKFNEPVDNFTMTLRELEQSEQQLNAYFSRMMQHAVAQPRPQNNLLNAANLQRQEEALKNQRAASVQKNHVNNSNRAPAAPTTSHPPFPYGSQSPQGVPAYNVGRNDLTQDKLILPAAKKRKGNAASPPSTPAQTQNTQAMKSSPPPKVESSEAHSTPAAPVMIKCPVPDCDGGAARFATKDELEKHTSEAHDPTYNIKDPVDAAIYAIESMRIVLNLDANGKSKPITQEPKMDKETQQASAKKTTASLQSVKQEADTPMSRNPTQTGPSPSSNLLKTPQATANVRTPASEAKSAGKDLSNAGAKAASTSRSPADTASDPWENSLVKPGWFKNIFGGVADLNRPVPVEVIKDWAERNPVTPPTSPSSGTEKASPQKSDISVNDNLNINIIVPEDSDWVVADWVDDLPGDMASLEIPDFMGMDWETVFGKEDEEDVADIRKGQDPYEPREWLKAWAPEKLKKNEGAKKARIG